MSVGPTTTLVNAINGSVGSLDIAAPADFPASGNFYISIDAEIMLVSGGQGTPTWTVVRAQNGTTGTPHLKNATVSYWNAQRTPPYPGSPPIEGMTAADKSRRYGGKRQPDIIDVRIVSGDLGNINVSAATEYDGDSVFVGPGKAGAVSFNDGGTWRIVSDTHPFPVNASVTASTPFVTHQRGQALVGSTATTTLVTIGSSVDVTGFSLWGEGDGLFSVMVASTIFYQWRTNFQNPSLFIALPGRHQFASGLDLKVTNLSDAGATYSGVVLSE